MLIFVGLMSTIISLFIAYYNYKAQKERMTGVKSKVMYTEEERKKWKKEAIGMYIFALIPIIFCALAQLAINAL